MTILWVALGAAVGAPLRYLIDAYLRHYVGPFPWGTLTVNLTGSFLLGVLISWPLSANGLAAWGAGFCGALTTYSTFGVDTVTLLHGHGPAHALRNIAFNVIGCATAVALGVALSLALGRPGLG